MSDPIIRAKKLTDVTDQAKKTDILRSLLTTVSEGITKFQSAYQTRRNELLEINALYRNKSYWNSEKAQWQTKGFAPLVFDAVERKTSVIHEALWGNRYASPFTVTGKTAEDHSHAFAAESLLNNIMDSIEFYDTSEECLRSAVKYGLGVYRYGWETKDEEMLWREPIKDSKGKIARRADGLTPVFKFVRKKLSISRPFVRNVDIVDHIGWDPTAKKFAKYDCDYVYEIFEESRESILKKERRGEYDPGTFNKLASTDPHGISGFEIDSKEIQLKQDDGVQGSSTDTKPRYNTVDWYGWFDIDGDGEREFIHARILENRQVLFAEENLTGEYPFLDVQYSKSLHSLTPWGVVDPVISLQYLVNDIINQRGDATKLKLNPQFAVNVDMILEDHSYVSEPGAFHPFAGGADGDVRRALNVLQFDNPEYISFQEQDRLISLFQQSTGIADYNQVLSTSNKDTPASTMFGIFNQQQAGNSMIINGILSRHGVLGSRILRLVQLFGDEKFVLKVAGKRGLEFRTETLENIMGDYDIKVTTSSFFGNKAIELQQLIQLKPMWAQSPHIDQIELDKAILENILPKRVELILKTPSDPLTPLQEEILFASGQGESVSLSESEDLASLEMKHKAHTNFMRSKTYRELDMGTKEEFETYMKRIENRMQAIQTQQMLQQQAALKGMGDSGQPQIPGMNGNLQNTGIPAVREMGNNIRPMTNNIPR